MRQKRHTDSKAGVGKSCCAPSIPECVPLALVAPQACAQRMGDPLLACHHYSTPIRNICLCISFAFHHFLPFGSSFFIHFWVSVTKMPSNSGEGTSSWWHRQTREAREGMWRTFYPSLFLTSPCRARCSHPHTGRASRWPPTPWDSACHRGSAYMLWHSSIPTEDNTALQRPRLYWFVWEFILCLQSLGLCSSHTHRFIFL